MERYQRPAIISFIMFAIVIVSINDLYAQPVKIKGFHIGMSIDDALENMKRLGFDGLSVRESAHGKTSKYYFIRPGSGDPFKIETELNKRTVSTIYFSPNISDRLFHTRGIGPEIFRKSFAEAYGFPEMNAFKENPGSELIVGWEQYDLKHGCRIRIFLNKSIEIIATDTAGDFSFD